MTNYGWLCILPPLTVVVAGIFTRRPLESLLLGCLLGCLLIDRTVFPSNFLDLLQLTLRNEALVWVILVCGTYGMLIQLMVNSGGAVAFGVSMLRYISSQRTALLVSWLTGVVIFIDDYLSALSTGLSMRKITDRFGISRKLLAYIVNATAAPICVLVPISTWGIYTGKLLEENNMAKTGEGLMAFAHTIPYNFYPLLAVLVSLLVAGGVIPLPKSLRQVDRQTIPQDDETQSLNLRISHPRFFILPMIVLVVGTLLLGGDALKGAMLAFVFTIILFASFKVMPYSEISEAALEGFKSMIMPLAILSLSFFLKTIGDKMQLTPYVVDHVKDLVPYYLFPAGVFMVLSIVSYSTCSAWGMYAVALPIVIPLAATLGVNVWLTIAAVLGAGSFGSNASFFSDCTILTASSTQCDASAHSFSQLPLVMVNFFLATLLYVIAAL